MFNVQGLIPGKTIEWVASVRMSGRVFGCKLVRVLRLTHEKLGALWVRKSETLNLEL